MLGGLSLSDPRAQAFVNGCIRHPDLMVMLRKGANARIIRSSSVTWVSRTRRAQSRSALASVPWEETSNVVVSLLDSVLEEAQPPGWGRGKIANCMQVVFVDASEGEMGDFVRKLVEIWCQVYRVDGKDELYETIKGPYEAAGELEEFQVVTPEVVLNYYENLWGYKLRPDLD